MTLFVVGGIPVKLHPSILCLLVFSLLTAELSFLLAALALVVLHEAAHCLAARALGVRVLEMEFAPFGGVARMEGLEARPLAEVLVALAGPCCNLLLAMAACLLCHLWPAAVSRCAFLIALNLALCLLNLLPALPLDGGRLLRAGLSLWIGRRRAGAAASAFGIVLGAGMVCMGAGLVLYGGKLNLTLLVSGLYLLFCAARLLRERPFDSAREILRLERRSMDGQLLPVRELAASRNIPPEQLLRAFRPGRWHRVVFVDERLQVVGTKWQGEIVEEILQQRLQEGAGGV